MRGLGLLTRKRSPELTAEGERLATIFQRFDGSKFPCLGDISVREQIPLKALLGLDYRKHKDLPVALMRRRATFETIKRALEKGLDSAAVLEQYAQIGRRASNVAIALHHAFVWELLSCGLALAFSMLLLERRKGRVVRSLRRELGGRSCRPLLGRLSAGDSECSKHIIALLRAAMNLEPQKLTLDPGPARLAALLIIERDPGEFLRQLIERHRLAKPETPWIMLEGDKIEILTSRKNLPSEVQPRTYRLDAFNQLLRDLGMIR
jgi:hypothetical protein